MCVFPKNYKRHIEFGLLILDGLIREITVNVSEVLKDMLWVTKKGDCDYVYKSSMACFNTLDIFFLPNAL